MYEPQPSRAAPTLGSLAGLAAIVWIVAASAVSAQEIASDVAPDIPTRDAFVRAADSPVSRATLDIRAMPDPHSQNARMTQLIATMGAAPGGSLSEDDIADLGALADGDNFYVATMAAGLLGCAGARAGFFLPTLHARLGEAQMDTPLVGNGVWSEDILRAAIWRIQTNTACDRPIPDPHNRVSPVVSG